MTTTPQRMVRGEIQFGVIFAVLLFLLLAVPTLVTLTSDSATRTTTIPSTPSTSTSFPLLGTVDRNCAPAAALVPGFTPVTCPSPAGYWGLAPTMVIPSGKPPSHMEAADLITGAGPAVKNGDILIVQYELGTFSSHKVVQSTWSGPTFSFSPGLDEVVPGWDLGVLGMRPGGRRELIIPPTQGYGELSPGPDIAKNDTLVYIIDLYKIN